MDPESYLVSPGISKLNREQGLVTHNLFPMYPSGVYQIPRLFSGSFWIPILHHDPTSFGRLLRG